MLNKTRGIVLQTIKHTDTSLVLKIYTEDFGLQSFITKGIRSKKQGSKVALFQPMTILDLVILKKEKSGLGILKDAAINTGYLSVFSDIAKSSVLLFLNEVLYKALPHEQPDHDLFEFLIAALMKLDSTEEVVSDFPLIFMLGLSNQLGFFPHGEYSAETPVFDLKEGIFKKEIPPYPHYLKGEASKYFSKVKDSSLDETGSLKINNYGRKQLLFALIDYYSLHLSAFKGLKSHLVLADVLE